MDVAKSIVIDFKGNPIFKIKHEKAKKEFLQAEGLRPQESSDKKWEQLIKWVLVLV